MINRIMIYLLLCSFILLLCTGCSIHKEENIFDEIYNALTQNMHGIQNKPNFRYAISRMQTLTKEDIMGIHEEDITTMNYINFFDQNREEHLIEIRCFDDHKMIMYITINNHNNSMLEIYQYNVKKSVLETTVYVYPSNGVEDMINQEVQSDTEKAREIFKEFIREFIKNNMGCSSFTLDNWGEYQKVDHGIIFP